MVVVQVAVVVVVITLWIKKLSPNYRQSSSDQLFSMQVMTRNDTGPARQSRPDYPVLQKEDICAQGVKCRRVPHVVIASAVIAILIKY